MADPALYSYPSPLEGHSNLEPLPNEISEDGKSYVNPARNGLSESYEKFTSGIDNGRRGGFDAHIYFYQADEEQSIFARQLWERIRREFPELRIYKMFDKPIGPHPVAMFEVNIFTPAQFGAFIPWLIVNRGPLSVLLHPNSENDPHNLDEYQNHTQRATWLGQPLPLNTKMLLNSSKQKLVREV